MKSLIFLILFLSSSIATASTTNEEVACYHNVKKVIDEFKPDFVELQAKLALYKTAWTTLVLNKARGEKLVTMEKEISEVTKLISKKKNDPEFNDQYKKLLNYRPYVDKWEKKSETTLPLAINLLAQNVRTDDFYELVLKENEDKEAIQKSINKYAVDFETVKTSELLHDLYRKDPASNNYLLKLTNQVSSALRGRDHLKDKDKKFFENIIENIEGKLTESKDDFIKKIKKACQSEDEVMNVINSEIICKNASPSTLLLNDLEKVFEFEPVLEAINRDAELSFVKKEYLRVAPKNPSCSVSVLKNNILFDLSSIPKNGDYYLSFTVAGKEVIKSKVVSGSAKFDFDKEGKILIFDSESKKSVSLNKDDLSDTKVIGLNHESYACFVKESPQKEWKNYTKEIELKNLSHLTSDEKKIVDFEKNKGKGNFVIVDEVNEKIKVISHEGKLITEVLIKEGFDRGDESFGAKGNKTLGAGVYLVERKGKSKMDSNPDILFLTDSKKQGVSIRGYSSNCDKCIKVPDESLHLVINSLKTKSKIYVLPEDTKNKFTLNSHKDLSFKPSFGENDYYYNTSKKLDYYPTKFSLSKAKLINPKDTWTKNIPYLGKKEIQVDTEVTKEFLKTLENEKYNLMKLYGLTSDEYNELAKIAFGILGNESYFGNPSMPRAMKEVVPAAVPVAKNYKNFHSKDTKALDKLLDGEFKEAMKLEKEALGELWQGVKGSWSLFKNSVKHYNPSLPGSGVTSVIIGSHESVARGEIDISKNSRGLIQMKNIPDKIEQKYKITKSQLMEPRAAAISAIGFLAEAKNELEIKARTYNQNVRKTRQVASGKIKNSKLEVIKGHDYPEITNENWQKYIHYIYMGSSHEITNATATPEYNLYYKDILHWNQALEIEEAN